MLVDIATGTANSIIALGVKDHSLDGNGLDASNRDDTINIATYPVLGYFLPDAITSVSIGGKDYILSANEGDSRDYDGYSEETRVADLVLDPVAFPNATNLQEDAKLGRLKTTIANGDTDGDGDHDVIYSYGARSFSIWDASDGSLVWDSGDDFEQKLAERIPEQFNSNNDDNDSFDSRSDDKGPEPEAITVANYDGRVYALIGLERVGGIMVYDISDPAVPVFVEYVANRNYDVDADSEEAGDLGVEDIEWISAEDSPNGSPLVVTANEVSGTISIWSVGENVVNTAEFSPREINFEFMPNPFHSSLTIGYELIEPHHVSMEVFDMLGRSVQTLTRDMDSVGRYRKQFDLAHLPQGMYQLVVRLDNRISSQKLFKTH